jgi:hypothetical protein
MSLRRTLPLVATVALALAGCGVEIVQPLGTGDGMRITPTSSPQVDNRTPAGVEEVMYRSFEALRTRNANAIYAMLTKACQKAIGNRLTHSVLFRLEQSRLENISGWKFSEMKLLDVRVVDFTPARATVTSAYDLGDGTLINIDDEPSVVVYEDGEWKSDCAESPA